METPQPPKERGEIIYRWTPPAMGDDVLDVGGTPGEYAVYDLPRTERADDGWIDYGGCIIYGYFPNMQRWEANANARCLVRHLIEENRELLAACKAAFHDMAYADAPEASDLLRAAIAKAENR